MVGKTLNKRKHRTNGNDRSAARRPNYDSDLRGDRLYTKFPKVLTSEEEWRQVEREADGGVFFPPWHQKRVDVVSYKSSGGLYTSPGMHSATLPALLRFGRVMVVGRGLMRSGYVHLYLLNLHIGNLYRNLHLSRQNWPSSYVAWAVDGGYFGNGLSSRM